MNARTDFRGYIALFFIISTSFCANAADTHYVSTTGTNNPPYTNWADAATNIQWAVNEAALNDTVLVSNGVYALTNQCLVTNYVTVRSVNGRNWTSVNGNYPLSVNRCFLMSNSVLDGFTISNGFGTGPFPSGWGGGVYCYSGAVYNCTIISNRADGGGGAYLYASQMTNCIIINNISTNGYAGGVYADYSIFDRCSIVSNEVQKTGTEAYGGGGYFDYGSMISNCIFYANIARNTGVGGGVTVRRDVTFRNCLFYKNQALSSGGGVWVRLSDSKVTRFQNCTIVSNSGTSGGGGGMRFDLLNTGTSVVENCIIYYNSGAAPNSNMYQSFHAYCMFSNNCIGAESSGVLEPTVSSDNIFSDPGFVDFQQGNYRLNANSHCFNTGTYRDWMNGARDLDGQKRIQYGIVDMGAYERINAGAIFGFR